ncbi:hypothetical protein [uncultured Anaerococcus sp.]|uniref:hypothetical protein n=1 Tax=uncultured Anaerococcus sp. TaxID=293428 RepID=UPI00288AD3B8|nr:hypothetical protein [uncultured Anaerococcus sp.]
MKYESKEIYDPTLALACAFIAKPSYANEGDQNNVPLTNHLEKSTEDLMEEKQNLKNLIEETKKSPNYLKASDQIKFLYNRAIEFNSKALDQDRNEWLIFSIDNLKKDLELIEKLTKDDYQDEIETNEDSPYFKDPSYKVAYLRLDKEKRALLDEFAKNKDKPEALTKDDLKNLVEARKLVFFSDWLYPFMEDENHDGLISENKYLEDKIKSDADLFEKYRRADIDKRNKLMKEDLNNSNNPPENDPTSDEDNKDKNPNQKEEDTPTNTDTNPEEDEKSKYKYQSMFYIKNKTREFYDRLSDDQRKELDKMNTDGDGVLSIEELEKSANYQLPIMKDKDWLYPFMYDKNEDGIIDDSDRNSNNASENTDNTNNPQTGTTNNEEKKAEDLIDEKYKNSAFYNNSKTKEAYLKLSDDRKEILDKMNTDGKYPLTIEEVKNSGMFKIPVHKDDWIYPFMIDRNNSGEVGEYDGQFEDAEPSEKQASKKPNAKIITTQEQASQNQYKQSQKVEPIQGQEKVVTESSTKTVDQQGQAQTESSPKLITYVDKQNLAQTESSPRPITYNNQQSPTQVVEKAQAKQPTYKTVANTNVKTGIKGLGAIVIVLIISTIGSLLLRKKKIEK